MPTELFAPIYLNQDAIQDLSSILIDGYFESITIKQISDNTVTGRYQNNNKSQCTNDYKNTKGDKDDNTVIGNSCYNYGDICRYLEGRNFDRNDITLKRVYASFSIYNNLRNKMNSLGLIKYINDSNPSISNVYPGDYVDITGCLEVNTISNCIDNCILILNNYGTSNLDKLFDNKHIGPLSYTIICELLKTIQKELNKGSTFDITINSLGVTCILPINSTYISKHSYIYDDASCDCCILGKVSNVAYTPTESIGMLRKTGLDSYYTKLLNSFIPYFQVLNDNGFLIPGEFITSFNGPALEIIPLSICM
ncbi:hypothetical protein GCM10008908_21570 [Clostridium subterminale]|uniref:Uncharacterized protein n=1 Tax=Clostridium subterminale TaxID=1550 RepID=A0ABN1KQD4_CLOSU